MMPKTPIIQDPIWQRRVRVMDIARSGILAVMALVLWTGLGSTAQAEVFQTPAGRTASASVTLHVFVQPKIVMEKPKNSKSEIRPVENAPKNMQIYYQYQPLNKGLVAQANNTGSFNRKGQKALQVSLNPLRSNKGNTLLSITKEIKRNNVSKSKKDKDLSGGTVELSTVFL